MDHRDHMFQPCTARLASAILMLCCVRAAPGQCPSTWQPGDYIVDTYIATAGGPAFPLGNYTLWTGFFTGSAPNWKNMTISEAPSDLRDTAERIKVTTIVLE